MRKLRMVLPRFGRSRGSAPAAWKSAIRSAIDRLPLMLILVSLPSFLSRQAATNSSGFIASVAQNSFRNATRDGSSCGSTPDCSRNPVNQVFTAAYSSIGLSIEAITQKVRTSFRKTEHPGERLDLFLAPRQRRGRLDHLRGLHLLRHLGIRLEGLAVLPLEENFLDRRTRTLTARFPRFRGIADQQHPQRNPFGRRLEDLVDGLMLKCREANTETLIHRGQHRLANRDTRIGSGCGGDRRLIRILRQW